MSKFENLRTWCQWQRSFVSLGRTVFPPRIICTSELRIVRPLISQPERGVYSGSKDGQTLFMRIRKRQSPRVTEWFWSKVRESIFRELSLRMLMKPLSLIAVLAPRVCHSCQEMMYQYRSIDCQATKWSIKIVHDSRDWHALALIHVATWEPSTGIKKEESESEDLDLAGCPTESGCLVTDQHLNHTYSIYIACMSHEHITKKQRDNENRKTSGLSTVVCRSYDG